MSDINIPYLVGIQFNVMDGQCKNSLLRVQVRYTAIFLFPGLLRGWCGTHVGLFAPKHNPEKGYRCTGFEFSPWLAPDIAVANLPRFYVKITRAISFRNF
jgi:hypothetical protein